MKSARLAARRWLRPAKLPERADFFARRGREAAISHRAENQTYCNIACNIRCYCMRLVLDTAAMVAAIRSDAGASRRLLVAGLEGG